MPIIDAVDYKGRTPLHLAVRGGHVSMVSLLLENGANSYIKDLRGLTPYDLALNSTHKYRDAMIRCIDIARAREGHARPPPPPPQPSSKKSPDQFVVVVHPSHNLELGKIG
jgi:ankyrin repeat protein